MPCFECMYCIHPFHARQIDSFPFISQRANDAVNNNPLVKPWLILSGKSFFGRTQSSSQICVSKRSCLSVVIRGTRVTSRHNSRCRSQCQSPWRRRHHRPCSVSQFSAVQISSLRYSEVFHFAWAFRLASETSTRRHSMEFQNG